MAGRRAGSGARSSSCTQYPSSATIATKKAMVTKTSIGAPARGWSLSTGKALAERGCVAYHAEIGPVEKRSKEPNTLDCSAAVEREIACIGSLVRGGGG